MSKQVITDEEILNLSPGRDLDSHIALRVMGLKEIIIVGKHYFTDPIDTQLKSYSTDIRAAWEVVEKLSRGQVDRSFVMEFHFERYYARFGEVPFRPYRNEMYVTAPEAICKAALQAVIGGSGNE